VIFREFLASGRLSDEEKGTALFVFGALLSGPVVVLAPVVVIVWLVTGRGPGRWLGWGQACVNPFPKPDVSHISDATRRAMAETRPGSSR
jgi:hypothetical protein